VPSLIRRVGGIFGGPIPQVFMTSWNLLISIGQLNCEEMTTRIYVALSCLSWGCFCSRDSVSNAWRYATDAMDFITYLKDQNVALSWLVQEDFCRRMQHSWSCYLFCCCIPQNLANCTDCSECSSELYFTVMRKLMVYPQGPTYYNFCFNKQRARVSSLVSVCSEY